MSQLRQSRRLRNRRLSEIRASHSLVRSIFSEESSFDGDEFENAVRFVDEGCGDEVVSAASVIRKLVRWYQDGNPGVTCRVIDASSFTGGFLWLQSAVNRVVEDLSAENPAVVFITGLGETIRSPKKRWSAKAERERIEGASFLEKQVGHWAERTGTPVTLFVA